MKHIDVMEEFWKEFEAVPKDEKMVMGYLACGNSPWDLLRMLIDEMKRSTRWEEFLNEVKIDSAQNDEDMEEPPGTTERAWLNTYNELRASCSDTVIDT